MSRLLTKKKLVPITLSLDLINRPVTIQTFVLNSETDSDAGNIVTNSMIKYCGTLAAYVIERDKVTFYIDDVSPIKVYNQYEVYELYVLGVEDFDYNNETFRREIRPGDVVGGPNE